MTTTDDARPLPHDITAERIVVGAIIQDRRALHEVAGILTPAQMYRAAHATIYATALEMADAGKPLDPPAVVAELVTRGEITRVGGAGYLHDCVAEVPSVANAGYYARIVAERAVLRGLVGAAARISQLGYDGQGDVDEIVDHALAAVAAVTEQRADADDAPLWVGESYPAFLDRLERPVDTSRSIPVPYADLADLVPAWRPGQLIIVGARPSVGKSTLAMDITRKAAIDQQAPVLLASMEMGEEELLERLTAAEARVSFNAVREHRLTDGSWVAIRNSFQRIVDAPLSIDDTSHQSLGHIRGRLRRMERAGHPARLLVVDYLGLMQAPPNAEKESRQQAVAAISRGLKTIAREYDIPVIALAQLNRGPELRAEKRPTMADLRESGQIENDADTIILMHRPDYQDKENERAGELDLLVAKQRNGPTGEITVAAQLHYARLANLAAS